MKKLVYLQMLNNLIIFSKTAKIKYILIIKYTLFFIIQRSMHMKKQINELHGRGAPV